MDDQYLTIGQEASWEVKVERSLFIAQVKEASSEQAARAFIQQISQQHKQATHNCSAYRIGWGAQETTYADDDGEPSGTAGRPILGAILSSGITNVAIVVTRYFGGKKLGVRGLIEAYGEAAREVIELAGKQEKILQDELEITCSYANLNQVLYWLEKYQAQVKERIYTEKVCLQFLVRQKDQTALTALLKDYGDLKLL